MAGSVQVGAVGLKASIESTNEGDSAYYDLFKSRRSGFGSQRSPELGAPIEPFLGIVLETLAPLP